MCTGIFLKTKNDEYVFARTLEFGLQSQYLHTQYLVSLEEGGKHQKVHLHSQSATLSMSCHNDYLFKS